MNKPKIYSVNQRDKHRIVIADNGRVFQTITVTNGSNEEIMSVTGGGDAASITTINNVTGMMRLITIAIPSGAHLASDNLGQRETKQPRPARTDRNAIDNGRRYQGSGEGINIWMVALVAWIGWCCLKALAIWSWAQLTYSLHYYGLV